MSNDAPISRIYKDLELYTDDAIAASNNPIPPSLSYKPSVAWIEFLLRVHPALSKANEFICYHNKFNWKPCVACRRSPEYAQWWRSKYWDRVVQALSSVQPQ
jgi:hypothetical protein